jgi:hypothetical protein
LGEEVAAADRVVEQQALAGDPAQVDAVELAAADLELAVLGELEAAADHDIGVRDQLGVELARALGHGRCRRLAQQRAAGSRCRGRGSRG